MLRAEKLGDLISTMVASPSNGSRMGSFLFAGSRPESTCTCTGIYACTYLAAVPTATAYPAGRITYYDFPFTTDNGDIGQLASARAYAKRTQHDRILLLF